MEGWKGRERLTGVQTLYEEREVGGEDGKGRK